MDGVLGWSRGFLRTPKQGFEFNFCSLVASVCLETLSFKIISMCRNSSEILSFCVRVSDQILNIQQY